MIPLLQFWRVYRTQTFRPANRKLHTGSCLHFRIKTFHQHLMTQRFACVQCACIKSSCYLTDFLLILSTGSANKCQPKQTKLSAVNNQVSAHELLLRDASTSNFLASLLKIIIATLLKTYTMAKLLQVKKERERESQKRYLYCYNTFSYILMLAVACETNIPRSNSTTKRTLQRQWDRQQEITKEL
jgi:hypothetical protein